MKYLYFLLCLSFLLFLSFLSVVILLIPSINPQENHSTNETKNITKNLNLSEEISVSITKFFPKEVKIGDVDFNIQIKNNLDDTLRNIAVFVSGKGFSTYEITTIEELVPLEKDYIFVKGNFRESGNITLKIKINNELFYQNVNVIDVGQKELVELREQEKLIKEETLKNLSIELENIKNDYTNLELKLSEKKDNNYDVSNIDLGDLKKYIRNIESSILTKNINEAEVNLGLAKEEYNYQKNKVDKTKSISILTRIKENALIITTIISAVLALFAISELLKKKGESTINVIKRVKKVISKIRGKR